jgi:hypothetical protein
MEVVLYRVLSMKTQLQLDSQPVSNNFAFFSPGNHGRHRSNLTDRTIVKLTSPRYHLRLSYLRRRSGDAKPLVDPSTPDVIATDSPLRLCSSGWRNCSRFMQRSQARSQGVSGHDH